MRRVLAVLLLLLPLTGCSGERGRADADRAGRRQPHRDLHRARRDLRGGAPRRRGGPGVRLVDDPGRAGRRRRTRRCPRHRRREVDDRGRGRQRPGRQPGRLRQQPPHPGHASRQPGRDRGPRRPRRRGRRLRHVRDDRALWCGRGSPPRVRRHRPPAGQRGGGRQGGAGPGSPGRGRRGPRLPHRRRGGRRRRRPRSRRPTPTRSPPPTSSRRWAAGMPSAPTWLPSSSHWSRATRPARSSSRRASAESYAE